MGWLITKYLVTAGIIVAVSEVAKRNDKLGALFVALPTVTILAIIWLYIEDQPNTKIASHMRYTFWYVLPSLPLFLIFSFIDRPSRFLDGAFCWIDSVDLLPLRAGVNIKTV